jgi:hypothetical protein
MAELATLPVEPQFQHEIKLFASGILHFIESRCRTCGAFVAAGANAKLIQIAESFIPVTEGFNCSSAACSLLIVVASSVSSASRLTHLQ